MKNPSSPECYATQDAIRKAMTVVSGKWKIVILVALRTGTQHFRALERSIPGISTKVLAKELKELEAHRLIQRTVHPGTPALVEYTSLPYAETLDPLVQLLREWGSQHQLPLEK